MDENDPIVGSVNATELFGVTLRPVGAGFGGVVANGKARTISVHRTDEKLLPYIHDWNGENGQQSIQMPGLFKTFKFGRRVTLLLRSISNGGQTKIVKNINQGYPKIARALQQYLTINGNGETHFGHELMIWGEDPRQGIGGKPVMVTEIGSTVRDVLFRRPLHRIDLFDDATGVRDQLTWAAPRQVIWNADGYTIDNQRFVLWYGELLASRLPALLELGFDVLLSLEVCSDSMFTTCLIRNVGTDQRINALNERLKDLGKWEWITGKAIQKAFKYFVPGAAPFGDYRYQQDDPIEILRTVADSLSPVGDPMGDFAIGKVKGQSYRIDSKQFPTILWCGPTKEAGKTTTAGASAFTLTSNILWVSLTTTVNDPTTQWIKETNGKVVTLDLPDTTDGVSLDKEECSKRQEQLHAQDRKLPVRMGDDLYALWIKKQRIVFLPLVIRPQKDTIRYLNFVRFFLEEFRIRWEKWYQMTGERVLVVVDNLSTIIKGSDPLLGEIPVHVGRRLGLTIANQVSNGANRGILTWVLTHSPDDLKWVTDGFYGSFNLHVDMTDPTHLHTGLIHPSTGEKLVTLNTALTPELLKIFGRKETRGEETSE